MKPTIEPPRFREQIFEDDFDDVRERIFRYSTEDDAESDRTRCREIDAGLIHWVH